eukprot:Lithocolla_globosa_v1_NODE_4446_length_1432_cov_14.986202.p2 type:complete len:195 gc:universal NODE_4446_length_1432_cov_14.986202:484-1068(+)
METKTYNQDISHNWRQTRSVASACLNQVPGPMPLPCEPRQLTTETIMRSPGRNVGSLILVRPKFSWSLQTWTFQKGTKELPASLWTRKWASKLERKRISLGSAPLPPALSILIPSRCQKRMCWERSGRVINMPLKSSTRDELGSLPKCWAVPKGLSMSPCPTCSNANSSTLALVTSRECNTNTHALQCKSRQLD